MRLGIIITLASTLCVGCGGSKTDFQFGNTVPSPSPSMHNDLGNVQENEPMNILAPISEATPEQVIPTEQPVKIVQPRKPKSIINTVNVAPEKSAPEIYVPAPQLAQPAPTNWQPNEALLIRGNELLIGLQKEQGKKPSITDMQKRLQSHMGLSATQALQVISALGLS